MELCPGVGVAALRKTHDMSIERLSELSGIDASTLKVHENSKEKMSVENSKYICDGIKDIP